MGNPLADTETPAKLTGRFSWKKAKEAYNTLLNFCIRERIVTVNRDGGELVRTESGKLLKVNPPTPATPYPFQLLIKSATSIRVRYGVVNDGSTGNDWIPTGMSDGDVLVFTLSIGSSGAIYLHIVTDATTLEVTSVTIQTASSTPTSTVNDAYRELGSFAINSAGAFQILQISQAVQTSVGYLNANGSHIFWQI